MLKIILLTCVFLSGSTYAQDLLKERIWKITSRKRSIFLDKGIFHSKANPIQQKLVNIRNSYVPARGYERIVFDFSSSNPPKVYGHISSSEKKVSVDFMNTSLGTSIEELKSIKFLKEINFYSIDKNKVTATLTFDEKVSYDVFVLENPGRLVIDVKK